MTSTKNDAEWVLAWATGFNSFQESESAQPSQVKQLEIISNTEYLQFKEGNRLIHNFISSKNLIEAVHINLNEFLECVVINAKKFLETRMLQEEDFESIGFDLSRLLLNMLLMFRAFLDHTDASISREFGKSSSEMQSWKGKQAECFDSANFAYRFFYKLRNYTQHVGMPPIHFSFFAEMGDPGIGLKLNFSRDELLKEDLWKQVKKDLVNQHEEISVLEVVNDWSESFISLSGSLLEFRKKMAFDAAERIVNLRKKHNLTDEGKLCLFKSSIKAHESESLALTLSWFPEINAHLILSD